MKNVFCKRLAACVCIQQSPSQSPEPPLVPRRKNGFASGDHDINIPHIIDTTTNVAPETNIETRDKLLREIRDLLAARRQSDEEQCYEADKENEIKYDWMLAAAVLDRICAIAFATILIGGTVAVIAIFATHA